MFQSVNYIFAFYDDWPGAGDSLVVEAPIGIKGNRVINYFHHGNVALGIADSITIISGYVIFFD